MSRPVAVSQAGIGGIAVAGGQSFASAGVSPEEKNPVKIPIFYSLICVGAKTFVLQTFALMTLGFEVDNN